MLDGLEAADRTAELIAGLGVVGGHLDRAPCTAGLLAEQCHRGAIQRCAEHLDAGAQPPDQTCRGIDELQAALLAGRVQRGQRCHVQAGSTGVDREHGGPSVGAGQHVQQLRRLPVEHEMLVAGDVPGVTDGTRRRGDRRGQPSRVVLGEGDTGDQVTGGDPRQHRGAFGRIVGLGQQIWHQHRRRQEAGD